MFRFKVDTEASTLVFSAAVAGFFALVGIFWGIATGSLAILFDGAYSFVSLLLSLLSVQALKLAESPANNQFNFGRILIEPLTIAVKGLVILLVCVVSFASALVALLNGGREVMAGMASLFALISLLGCVLTWLLLKRRQAEFQSALIGAEARQWQMDSVLSAAVLLGFVLAWALQRAGHPQWAAYADPLLVIAASVYFMLIPVRMTFQALRELLLTSPNPALRKQVYRALSGLGIAHNQCKMAKVGSYLILEVKVQIERTEQMDEIRPLILQHLSDLPLEVRLQVDFYAAKKPMRSVADHIQLQPHAAR